MDWRKARWWAAFRYGAVQIENERRLKAAGLNVHVVHHLDTKGPPFGILFLFCSSGAVCRELGFQNERKKDAGEGGNQVGDEAGPIHGGLGIPEKVNVVASRKADTAAGDNAFLQVAARRRVAGRTGRMAFTRPERGLIAAAAVLVFSRVFAFSLVLPGFRPFGATLTSSQLLVGIALGAYGLTMALAQLANGWLSDHVGRRPVLLAGSALFVLGSAWSAMAHSIWALIAARLLQGLGGVSSVAMAAVGETVPEERRTTAMALVGVPAGLGFFLGFILGPLLQPLVGFRGLFWAMAGLGVVAALPLALRPLPAPAPPPQQRRVGLPVAALALAGFTINFAMNQVAFFLPGIPLSHDALALVLVGAFVVMGGASRGIDRSRAVAVPVALSLLVLAGGAALFTLRTGLLLLVGGLGFFAAHATLSAVLPSQVSRLAGRTGGRGHGVQLVVAYLGTAAGGAVAGGMAELADKGALAHPAAASAGILAGLCVLVAALAVAALPRKAGAPLPQDSNRTARPFE